MTQKEFFVLLAKRRQKHGFQKTASIRELATRYCPVCAVANEITGNRYCNIDFERAAFEIGLDLEFANKIVLAADGHEPKSRVAQRLRKAVGLTS